MKAASGIRILILATGFCFRAHSLPKDEVFGDKFGCLFVRDIESGNVIYSSKTSLCTERLYACSTFKFPLALMAFDDGVLQDENTKLKWDGKPQMLKTWEQDHTARTWMRDSVVWYSQRLTPKIGMEKIKKYLADFKYGNEDFSGGITKAWLSSSLKVSVEEQVDFLRRAKKNQLKIKKLAVEKALSLLPQAPDQITPHIVGKTGSCFSWDDPAAAGATPFRIGWYVGFFTRGTRDFAFALAFRDKAEKGKSGYGGPEARKIAVENLEKVVK